MPTPIITLSQIVAIVTFVTGVLMPGLVLGQEVQCAPTTQAMEDIAAAGLKPMWVGLDDRGIITSVFVDEHGDWLLVLSGADGVTCKLATGTAAEASVPVFGVES